MHRSLKALYSRYIPYSTGTTEEVTEAEEAAAAAARLGFATSFPLYPIPTKTNMITKK